MTDLPDPATLTPMMLQWHSCKQEAEGAILLFRMGDFYEAFYEDAECVARELDLTLTKRQETSMAGVPHHSVEGYIDRLVAKGFRVAIAEQTEDPKQAKGLVKRELVRVVTPGTALNSSLIPAKANNFLAAACRSKGRYGLAFMDVSTAEFRVIELADERALLNELYRIRPSECLSGRKFYGKHAELFSELKRSFTLALSLEDDWRFEEQVAEPALKQHFKVQSLDGFGLRGMHAGVSAAGALLTYIQDQLKIPVGHIRRLSTYTVGDYLVMDRVTQRNLELTESLQDGSRRNTLLEVLDATQTPMGGRLLRQWIQRPLTHVDAIRQRQDAVEQLFNQTATSAEISDLLAAVKDLERLMMRVSAGYAGPRDLLSLAQSLAPLPRLRSLVKQLPHPLCSVRLEHLRDLSFLSGQIAETLADEVPLRVSDGGFIRSGFNRELDEVRAIQTDAKAWLKRHQEKLRDELGIKTLKVGQNRVFGYFIEVSKGQADKMPETFIRRQTLVNSERFISPTLKDYEAKVLTAEERIAGLETALFQALRESVAASYTEVMDCAQAIAQLDCLNGFAAIARERHYERPLVEDSGRLEIREGRHPVIEAALAGESFVPNDTSMSQDTQQLLLITGPNMAGKSTYIRQVALITILAQVGAFVPAQEARIGVVDKVFARIGASDDLSRGQSTFMVEMTEAANILNHVTDQSLVILDEIGRGTSTYDGISIAWAMAEHLLKTPGQRAKTLFATHYCELVRLEEMLPGAVNYHVAVKDCDDSILFLRKIVRGGTDRSYGIHVGRLAGLPESMLQRAESILSHLEANAPAKDQFSRPEVRQVLGTPLGKNTEDVQFLLFQPDKAKGKTKKESQALKTLTDADPNALSPLQAHALLIRLRDMVTA